MHYGERIGDSVNLVTSILVRYPEIGGLFFDPETRCLKFSFMINQPLDAERLQRVQEQIQSCLRAYCLLLNQEEGRLIIEYSQCANVSILEIGREVANLSPGEIGLMIALLKEEFGDSLLIEPAGALDALEEDLAFEEEVIGTMLESIRVDEPKRRLIAYREKGRVLVFDK